MAPKQEIIDKLEAHISKPYSSWYVGISESPRKRLFTDHNVDEKNGSWIYNTASNSMIAREIENHFHDLGCDGGPGGGDEDAKAIYAYKKTTNTNPPDVCGYPAYFI